MPDQRLCHLGCHDDERELVEATGVDAAEQGIDESFDQLPAEPALEDGGGAPLGAAGVVCGGSAFIDATGGGLCRGEAQARGRDWCSECQ